MNFSLGPRCARRICRPSLCRPLALPRRSFATRGLEDDLDEVEAKEKEKEKEPDSDDEEAEGGKESKTYKAFLTAQENFKVAKPRNWVTSGGEGGSLSPFPMNPSFKPPTPISDVIRSRMYADYMLDPETNSIRALSQRYHISLKRVEAILRLKGLEAAYVKGKPLQTGFLWGMEMLLGVKTTQAASEADRVDAHTADMLEQEENRDAARQRFQRQYWESVVDDGKEPLLPASLEHAKRVAERAAQAAEDHKSKPRLMPRFKDTPTVKSPRQKVQTVVREGRMPIHFVDVGGKYLDVDERLRRMDAAERRHVASARRSEGKVLHGFLKGRTPAERARRASVKRKQRPAS
ncbi:eukaryotic mitochondrial regulator protein-domain-containing protein [Mycena maculata]|uniref:Eukaryotic mitochondrial regulator protein-domain-containing protein n=1 Tax=Mycena maculata TaxID=230809 RepID=A0AAD7KCR6_9AGAR|nr:eukaryotic mitochondrial regulator protein-domain-containing protein [Mycena maculata]